MNHGTPSMGKQITQTFLYGAVSAALYFLLYLFEDVILTWSTRGAWYFLIPVGIAFLFSLIHGAFTGHFWDVLGIKAKK